MSRIAPVVLLPLLLGASPALSQERAPAGSLKALAECRALTDDAARLACFDRAAAGLLAAERSGDVVVVDREQARTARKQAFGFTLPSLDILKPREREDDLDQVTLTLASASQDGTGRYVLRTQDGQVWRQIDTQRPFKAPRAGSKAEVRRAALGSFFMNIDGQRAIRVRREQ